MSKFRVILSMRIGERYRFFEKIVSAPKHINKSSIEKLAVAEIRVDVRYLVRVIEVIQELD